MPKPELTFFTELPPIELTQLFEGRFVIDDLKALDAAVSVGILDLTEARARVIQRLNKAGVPVIAWLLLPEEQGYWFNINNYEQAAARYVTFKAWTQQYDLKWAGIGLDIEPDIKEVRQIMEQKQSKKLLKTLIQRLKSQQRVENATHAYQALVDLIHADGYPVESYHLPLISEERRAHATVLQRTAGLVDIKTDKEVLMLYSSFLRPNGDDALWSYAPEADSVGVGNTGGGVDVAGVIDVAPLTWEEFSRDLRLCVMQEKPVHIFCLEGCVKQGFLSKLITFDWDHPVEIPSGVRKVKIVRTGLTALLWLIERPWVLLIGLVSTIGLKFLFRQHAERPLEKNESLDED